MIESWVPLACTAFGLSVGFAAEWVRTTLRRTGRRVPELLSEHFRSTRLDALTVSERQFPYRVRADCGTLASKPDDM